MRSIAIVNSSPYGGPTLNSIQGSSAFPKPMMITSNTKVTLKQIPQLIIFSLFLSFVPFRTPTKEDIALIYQNIAGKDSKGEF